jgi:hypothetical protein
MSMTLEEALIAPLDDEYHARAAYRAALDAFGELRPFANNDIDTDRETATLSHRSHRNLSRWTNLEDRKPIASRSTDSKSPLLAVPSALGAGGYATGSRRKGLFYLPRSLLSGMSSIGGAERGPSFSGSSGFCVGPMRAGTGDIHVLGRASAWSVQCLDARSNSLCATSGHRRSLASDGSDTPTG